MFAPTLIDVQNAGPLTGPGNNTYLVVDRGEAVLVDAGTGGTGHLAAVARALDWQQARLADVVVTHIHADHASGAPALRAAFSGVRFAKYPWPAEDRRYAIDWCPLADRGEVRIASLVLTVVHTPGHSPDHIALWHADSGTVFTGDLVTYGGTVMVGWSHGGDMAQYLASLRRILALNPARLLPAHGAMVTEPAALLTGTIEHRLRREHQVYEAMTRGSDSVSAITESIYDGLDLALLPAAHDTVRAHLEKLKHDARASEVDGRWNPV